MDEVKFSRLPRYLFNDLHVNRVVSMDEVYLDGLRHLGKRKEALNGRKYLRLRRNILQSKSNEIYNHKENLNVDGSYLNVVENKRKRAISARFGYTPRSIIKIGNNHRKDQPMEAKELVRHGNYLYWKNRLLHQKLIDFKIEKERIDIENIIQESLRKAQAAEMAEWAYYNNPTAFLTLEEKVHNYKVQMVHITRHQKKKITSLKFSFPPQELIAVGNFDGSVVILNANDASLVGKLEGHGKPVISIDWSASNAFLVTSSLDKTSRLWNVIEKPTTSLSGKLEYKFDCIRILYGMNVILCAKFCPLNSNMFAQASYTAQGAGMVKIFHVDTGRCIQVVNMLHAPTCLVFNDRGSELYISDVSGSINRYTFTSDYVKQMKEPISKDSQVLYTSKATTAPLPVSRDSITRTSFSNDGKPPLDPTSADQRFRRKFNSVNAPKGETPQGLIRRASIVVLKKAAAEGLDYTDQGDWISDQLKAQYPETPVVVHMSYRETDIGCRKPSICMVDSNGHVRVLVFKKGKKMIETGFLTSKMTEVSFDELEEVESFTLGKRNNQFHTSCCVSTRSQYLASGSRDGTLFIYDPYISIQAHNNNENDSNQCFARLIAHSVEVVCVSWNADESILASGDEYGNVAIWKPRVKGDSASASYSRTSTPKSFEGSLNYSPPSSNENEPTIGGLSTIKSVNIDTIENESKEEKEKQEEIKEEEEVKKVEEKKEREDESKVIVKEEIKGEEDTTNCPVCSETVFTKDFVEHMEIHVNEADDLILFSHSNHPSP